jgi:23S rRNA (cytosine1962-C5)-methyltransferase
LPAPAQPDLHSRLALALQKRLPLLDEPHADALRLFNGFVEGESSLVADLYARTLVIFNHADPPETALPAIQEAQAFFLSRLRWVQAVVLKTRHAVFIEGRRGSLTYGSQPNRRICEEGVWYALDLLSSQDSGFYLDTRGLRQWLRLNMPGKSVLDTFAYTGSLGVAARAGGAQRVVYVDLDRSALNLAKDSYSLNGYPITKADFISGDFFTVASRMRRRGEQFDCVIVDPPFF